MSTINDGGPAFPIPGAVFHYDEGSFSDKAYVGASLRDLFALTALNGMLAHATRYRPRTGAPASWHDAIAQEAYELADAMLQASSVTKE
jgi:hypothetical protein